MGYVVGKDIIWQNDTGITLSNAANVFLEVGGSARCGWVPAATSRYALSSADFSSAGNAGTLITRETPSVAVARATDMIRGYPEIRSEHFFKIPVPGGAERLLIEWRGEHTVDSTGFALTGASTPTTRIWWYSNDRAVAYGSTFSDSDLAYAKDPINITWNSNNDGKLYSPITTLGTDMTGTNTPIEAISGMPLMVRSFLPASPANESSARNIMSTHSIARNPFATEHVPIGRGALLWGYTQNSAGGVDQSGYPKAQDKLGFVYEVGYPALGTTFVNGWNTATSSVTKLSVAGLSHVYIAFQEGAPPVGATQGGIGANETYFLDFTNASMTVRGRIKATWISESSRTW